MVSTSRPGATPVQGFAILGVRIPTYCGAQGVVIVATNQLKVFNTNCLASGSGVAVPISGLVAGETLVDIDFRPQTGQLYGLGFNASSGSGSATLYLLEPETYQIDPITHNPITATATVIGTPGGVANGSGTPIDLAGATAFGFDFDPTADRIRVVTSNGLNFRINPNDGTVAGGALDPPINGLPAGSTGLVAAAYTNSYGQTLGDGVTTLYTLDPGSDRLFIQNPAGTQTMGVPVTFEGQPFDFADVITMDIVPGIRVGSSNAPAVGEAHAVLGYGPVPLGNSAIRVMIDLTTGVARRIGSFTGGERWPGMAIGESPRNPTTLELTSSAAALTVGQPVTFTATIAPPVVVGVSVSPNNATGTIAFTIGSVPIAGCSARPITGMIATCTTSFEAPATVEVVAAFAGDSIHRGSTSTALNQVIGIATSTTSLTVTLLSALAGGGIDATATVTPAWATGTVTFHVDGVDYVATTNLSGGVVSTVFNALAEGVHEFRASYSGAAFITPSQSETVRVMIGTAGSLTQHFAEGATGFMQTDVGIFNANANPATVNVKLFPEAGDPVNLEFTLDPFGRRSIDVNELVRSRGVPDQGFSILVESTRPVAATRQMTWGRPVHGSTLESGLPITSQTWYFAEGATNIFSLYYMVENPNAAPANVVLTHLLEGGAAPVIQSDVIPPFTRRTYDINAVPGLASAALSTVVSADVPIVAERAMYLNTTNRLWEGGAVGAGAIAPSSFWSFGEGATGFFHTYLCLGNSGDNPSDVDVTYQLASGETVMKRYTVVGKSRLTIDVNGEDPKLAAAEFGMMIFTNTPIVAERAMWWGDFPWREGSVSIGSPSPNAGSVWAIGEGAEGGPSNEYTFVQVANRMLSPGRVRFTVAYDDGTHEQREYELVGSQRLTVRIGADFPNSIGRKFSVLVESLISNATITVEYARYQSPVAFGDGGGAALATRIR